MKINTIELENFKFHKELKFNINKQNCLIYGENGVGKSSIYWGIYSIFKKDSIFIEDYRTHDVEIEPNVKIILDDNLNTMLEMGTENPIVTANLNTIYFAHQDFLEHITTEENFYTVIENSLNTFFPTLNEYIKIFENINNNINESNHGEEAEKRLVNIQDFSIFIFKLQLRVNNIINYHFNEDFIISFSMDWGSSQLFTTGKYQFTKSKITIKINDNDNLKLNFNEAKLKLTAIAIFFSLIKLKEDDANQLKILVLDDFLTSLDMSNRKLIVQYILDNFKEYQKIILTHNIQFYNLIIRLLKLRKKDDNQEELTDWDIKNIFLSENDTIALINTQNKSYLDAAKKQLLSGEYHRSGNYARKEFERIVGEFKQILEIGKQEQLKHIVDALKSTSGEERFFKKPFLVLNKLSNNFSSISTILDGGDEPYIKVSKVNTEIQRIKSFLQNEECELSDLKLLLSKIEFYKDILFNPSVHNNDEIEIYRKECISSIKLLEELDTALKSLK